MNIQLQEIDNHRWMIPKSGNMRVPGIIFSSHELIKDILKDQSLVQVANVATLPGIVKYSLAMPDIHWGYGFPIGGVAAFDAEDGIISPGGVGYDINCGCRLLTTSLSLEDIKPHIRELVLALYKNIPAGVGAGGRVNLSHKELARVAVEGAAWAVKQGFGQTEHLERTENNGTLQDADPSTLSERAFKRGHDQLGTLGSGNHFLEVQVVERVYDERLAAMFNLAEGQVTVFIHTGSRGFGHQVCDDFLKEMGRDAHLKDLQLPDRQLAYAPLNSELGRRYLSAMACAANFAWANRQILMHIVFETFQSAMSISPRELGMRLLYDVCHNIAKMEVHSVDGRDMLLCVHRKGATRSLPPGHPLLQKPFQKSGQPVLIPGDMGTHSYVLAGAQNALELSFGSTCHGAGRVMSRSMAIKTAKGRSIYRELEDKGIIVQSRGRETLAEEMPEAYKNINQVVDVVHESGLATKVARLRPLGVIKG
jgi:tRNA-splicing ligase RtcB (3'-phosphate/5'-hydroxy nucleic acid ligase)